MEEVKIGTFVSEDGKEYPYISLLLSTYKNKSGKEDRISFGVKKAKIILKHIDAIQEFVDNHGG